MTSSTIVPLIKQYNLKEDNAISITNLNDSVGVLYFNQAKISPSAVSQIRKLLVEKHIFENVIALPDEVALHAMNLSQLTEWERHIHNIIQNYQFLHTDVTKTN